MLQERDMVLDDLHFYLLRAQQKMKANSDLRSRDESFAVGDMVYLKIQPYRQRSLAKHPYEKLAARFFGPYKIIQLVGQVVCELRLPHTTKLHPGFHFSQLKRAVGTVPVSPTLPDQLSSELELLVEPEQLLGVHKVGTDP